MKCLDAKEHVKVVSLIYKRNVCMLKSCESFSFFYTPGHKPEGARAQCSQSNIAIRYPCFHSEEKRLQVNFIAAVANDKLNLYGVQFHPEVDLITNGKVMLYNFLFGFAGLTGNYILQDR